MSTVPLVVFDSNGKQKTYILSELRLRGLIELLDYYKAAAIKAVSSAIEDDTPPHIVQAMIRGAVDSLAGVEFHSPEFRSWVSTIPGMARMTSLCMRAQHAEMTVDRVLELFEADRRNPNLCMEAVTAMAPSAGDDKGSGDAKDDKSGDGTKDAAKAKSKPKSKKGKAGADSPTVADAG